MVLSLAGSGLLLVGCAGGEPEPAADPVEQATHEMGADLYSEFCASCHGADAGGAVGPALTDGRVQDRVGDVDAVATVIAEGGDRMPGLRGRLTPEQIDAIARYVHDRL